MWLLGLPQIFPLWRPQPCSAQPGAAKTEVPVVKFSFSVLSLSCILELVSYFLCYLYGGGVV